MSHDVKRKSVLKSILRTCSMGYVLCAMSSAALATNQQNVHGYRAGKDGIRLLSKLGRKSRNYGPAVRVLENPATITLSDGVMYKPNSGQSRSNRHSQKYDNQFQFQGERVHFFFNHGFSLHSSWNTHPTLGKYLKKVSMRGGTRLIDAETIKTKMTTLKTAIGDARSAIEREMQEIKDQHQGIEITDEQRDKELALRQEMLNEINRIDTYTVDPLIVSAGALAEEVPNTVFRNEFDEQLWYYLNDNQNDFLIEHTQPAFDPHGSSLVPSGVVDANIAGDNSTETAKQIVAWLGESTPTDNRSWRKDTVKVDPPKDAPEDAEPTFREDWYMKAHTLADALRIGLLHENWVTDNAVGHVFERMVIPPVNVVSANQLKRWVVAAEHGRLEISGELMNAASEIGDRGDQEIVQLKRYLEHMGTVHSRLAMLADQAAEQFGGDLELDLSQLSKPSTPEHEITKEAYFDVEQLDVQAPKSQD